MVRFQVNKLEYGHGVGLVPIEGGGTSHCVPLW